MNAEILSVGTEILLGDIVNTNGRVISPGDWLNWEWEYITRPLWETIPRG